jgi:adenine-specific DNA methylase
MIYIILKNISFQEFSPLDEALKRFYINSNTDYHTSMLKTLKLQELLEPSKYVCFAQRRSLSLYIYICDMSRVYESFKSSIRSKGLMHHMSSLIK